MERRLKEDALYISCFSFGLLCSPPVVANVVRVDGTIAPAMSYLRIESHFVRPLDAVLLA
jgi:hypothetical protein